ncbi:MAG: PQQ-dependent sugar dehydrogenase [Desulfuromonadaceae bacterium]|nr:PQQ-dependent sugar dehydrogenase [Desulfuromonadaceae bacterium]
MKAVFYFLACFALLWCAVLLILGLKTYALDSPPLLFVVMLGLGFVLALIGKRWGRGALLLTAALAVLLAYAAAQRLLPPALSTQEFARMYCLNPEKAKLQHQQKRFRPVVHTQSLTLVCPDDTNVAPRFVLVSDVELQPVACGLKGVSGLVFGADQALYASATDSGLIYRLEPPAPTSAEAHLSAMEPSRLWHKTIVSSDLDRPTGLAWHADSLYVATRTAVVKLTPAESAAPAVDIIRTTAVQTVVGNLPPAAQAEHRAILVDDSGCIYLSVGAVNSDPLDVEWQRGTILQISAHAEVDLFAAGIHHARAMAWHPQTGALWLGEDSPQTLDFSPPEDEINVVCAGQDYGWPFCYGFKTPDRQLGTTTMCADTAAPLLTLPPHSVPAGLAFGALLDAPEYYRSMVYVALAGQQDDMHRQGFRVLGLPLDAHGDITGWGIEIAQGWATSKHVHGQPATLAVGPDGNLYLADSYAGVVYRFVFDSVSENAYMPSSPE